VRSPVGSSSPGLIGMPDPPVVVGAGKPHCLADERYILAPPLPFSAKALCLFPPESSRIAHR